MEPKDLTLRQLRSELKKLHLSPSGLKEALVARLKLALVKEGRETIPLSNLKKPPKEKVPHSNEDPILLVGRRKDLKELKADLRELQRDLKELQDDLRELQESARCGPFYLISPSDLKTEKKKHSSKRKRDRQEEISVGSVSLFDDEIQYDDRTKIQKNLVGTQIL